MIKLVRSNLLRLIKSKCFYAVLGVQAAIMLLMTLNYYLSSLAPNAEVWADMVFSYTACSPFAAVIFACFCSIFIGADYHNGTIRNKLIIGHPRTHIYLANLITCMLTALCMNVATMLIFYPITLPLLGGFIGEPQTLFTIFLFGNLIMLVYASLYCAVAMTAKNTVASLIITVASLLVMMFVAQYFVSNINAPPTISDVTVNEFGEIISQTIPNPARKSEEVLKCFGVLLNIFPSGQMTVLGSDLDVSWIMAVSSLSIIGVSTGAGIAVFRKENLK